MKFLLIFSIALVCIGLSTQFPSFEDCQDKHPVFADKNVYFGLINQCIAVTCSKTDDSFSAKPCPVYQCQPGKEIGQKDEAKISSKTYPDCCGGPICAP